MPVVFVVLDAFPNALVSPATTPTLMALQNEGGRHADGGLAEMTSATYPNHATFVTGRTTVDHGIVTNRVRRDGRWIPSTEVGPIGETIFDRCAAADRRAVAVVGDQYLIGVCGAHAVDHWPPGGVIPEGVERNMTGYIADREVVAAAAGLAVADADFVLVQFDAVDAARHMTGAWSDEAIAQCRATDAALGELLDVFAAVWDDTLVLVVSDHDQEDLAPTDPIDLRTYVPEAHVHDQGTAAQVVGPTDAATLTAIPGVEGVMTMGPDRHIVWGGPGQAFGRERLPIKADHGGPRTRTQVAVVGGGHPATGAIAAAVEARRPRATDWMGHMVRALGLGVGPGNER